MTYIYITCTKCDDTHTPQKRFFFCGACCHRCGAVVVLPSCFWPAQRRGEWYPGSPTRNNSEHTVVPVHKVRNGIETEHVDRAGTSSRRGHTVHKSRHSVARQHQITPSNKRQYVDRLDPGSPKVVGDREQGTSSCVRNDTPHPIHHIHFPFGIYRRGVHGTPYRVPPHSPQLKAPYRRANEYHDTPHYEAPPNSGCSCHVWR